MRYGFKDYRNLTGFTLSEMASIMQCTTSHLQLIETGQREGGFLFWEKFQKSFDIPDENMWKIMKRGNENEN